MHTTDAKTDRILESALPVFCQYGYKKTSMQDIATAAEMSRAALYLRFTSKDDVFRAGSIRAHGQSMLAVEAALAAQGDVFERIQAALTAFFSGLMAEINSSPHGSELFDASMNLVGDVVQGTRQSLVSLLAESLQQAARTGEIQFSNTQAASEDLATLLLATVDGLKHALPAPGAQQAAGQSFAAGLSLQLRLIRLSTISEAE